MRGEHERGAAVVEPRVDIGFPGNQKFEERGLIGPEADLFEQRSPTLIVVRVYRSAMIEQQASEILIGPEDAIFRGGTFHGEEQRRASVRIASVDGSAA